MKKINVAPDIKERKIRVLLVDDEREFLDLMKLTLNSEGYEADICWNGEGIQSVIEESRPDIILLDIKMDEVDGTDICRQIKQNPLTKHIKIILFSANENLELTKKRCGADGSLPKPYDKQLARITFREVLH